MSHLKITVLAENTAGKLGILGEHGLSFLIETGGEKILFDTGQGFVLKHNLETMGLTLADVKTVVLSHGHYDHTGGLHTALEMMDKPSVYAHSDITEPKFVCYRDHGTRAVGMPETDRDALLQQANWIHTERPTKLPGGLRLTGPIPRSTSFENTGGPFFLDEGGTIPDFIEDDQSAFLETENGTIVILGCAHSGIINTLKTIRRLTKRQPIHTVVGGMHLHSASKERMDKTVKALQKLNVRCIFPCHCTGLPAIARLYKEFPGTIHPCPAGTIISLNEGNSKS